MLEHSVPEHCMHSETPRIHANRKRRTYKILALKHFSVAPFN